MMMFRPMNQPSPPQNGRHAAAVQPHEPASRERQGSRPAIPWLLEPGEEEETSSSARLNSSQQNNAVSVWSRLQSQLTGVENHWHECIHDWYPNLHNQTYFLPPIHFRKVTYRVETVADEQILVPHPADDKPVQSTIYFRGSTPPPDYPVAGTVWPLLNQDPSNSGLRTLPKVQSSDQRDDSAMQQVHEYFTGLAEREHEVMMVLSQLEFRKYLDNQVDPITNAAISLAMPTASTIGRNNQLNKHQRNQAGGRPDEGEFDLLIISCLYGLIVGEVKAVGAVPILHLHTAILKVMYKAIQQLTKAENMLKHLTSDLHQAHVHRLPLRITKTLILPNVTSAQLLQVLNTDRHAQEALRQCLGVKETVPSAIVDRCLCKDTLKSGNWWHHAVTGHGPDFSMTHELYERLVARFCGPATTIEVPTVTTGRRTVNIRTRTEAVALTGLTWSLLTLHPEQVDLLSRPELMQVFLWGPPGVGKTVILSLKAKQWGRQGEDVHLVSSHKDSRASAFLVKRQLLHDKNIGFISVPASGSLSAPAESPDEPSSKMPSSLFQKLFRQKSKSESATPSEAERSGPKLYTHFYDFESEKADVKAAAEKLSSLARDGKLYVLADEAFCGASTRSGRFASFFANLVKRVPNLHLWAAAIDVGIVPTGMHVMKITTPVRCPPAVQREVALCQYLDDSLVPRYTSIPSPSPTDGPQAIMLPHRQSDGKLVHGHDGDIPEQCSRCADAIVNLLKDLRIGPKASGAHHLQYRDIFILCRAPDEKLPVVTHLRYDNLQVQVVTSDDGHEAIQNVALASENKITVTDPSVVSGLERRVVIVLLQRAEQESHDRLFGMSRCSSLLVCVGGSKLPS